MPQTGAVLAAFGLEQLACTGAEPAPGAFCETLAALGEGRIDVGTEDRNELVGHVRSLEALIEMAPREVGADLRAPRTPNRRTRVPLHASDVDIRLWQVCVYNFWNGRALDCRGDEEIAVDEGGSYTLVVSGAEHRPSNARAEPGITWLDAGPFLDGWLSYRMPLADDPLVRALHAALDGEAAAPELVPYLPRSAFCSRDTFESGGFDACDATWESTKR